MKAVVAAFNQEKALVGAFSVITNLRMELFQALGSTGQHQGSRPAVRINQTSDGVQPVTSQGQDSSDTLSATQIITHFQQWSTSLVHTHSHSYSVNVEAQRNFANVSTILKLLFILLQYRIY